MKVTNKLLTFTALLSFSLWFGSCTQQDCCMQSIIKVVDTHGDPIPDGLTFPWDGDTYDVDIISTSAWTLIGVLPNWIEEVTPSSGFGGIERLGITVKYNEFEVERTATLLFAASNGDKAILLIRQEPAAAPLFVLEGVHPDSPVTITFIGAPNRLTAVNILGRIPAHPAESALTVESLQIEGINGNAPILIGRQGGETIYLKFSGGNLVFRDAEEGAVPIGAYAEFQLINTALNGSYKQEANLDLMNKPWSRIATNSPTTNRFLGSYDGGGKSIIGLYIDAQTSDYVGLFGYIGCALGGVDDFGVVKNLNVAGKVTGRNRVGGIVGHADNGSMIKNCYSSVDVVSKGSGSGNGYGGGIVGSLNNSAVSHCHASGEVRGERSIGGIAGLLNGATGRMEYCYATGAVIGSLYVGGIVGNGNTGAFAGNNVALNRYVYGDGSVARIIYRSGGTYNYANNYAWENLGTNGGASFTMGVQLSHDRCDGANVSALTIATAAFWATWDPAIWTKEAGKLPGLFGRTMEIPGYIE